jgi:hypothetical protein
VLHEVDALLIPFFGENTRHRVRLISNLNAFEQELATCTDNYAVISGPPLIRAFDPKRVPGWRIVSATDAFLLLRQEVP